MHVQRINSRRASVAPAAGPAALTGERMLKNGFQIKNSKNNTDDKIQLLHPQDKKLSKIDRHKYDLLKEAILKTLRTKSLSHPDLIAHVQSLLAGKFDGSIGWYAEGVKLDLEARKVIGRTEEKPQKYLVL